MAKTIHQWLDEDVSPSLNKSVRWLSEQHFFRDPARPIYSDANYFFAPADGVIMYQKTVAPDEEILEIKGKPYSLRESMRNPAFDRDCLVIGIFMTFYDVHINRIPYTGTLTYEELDPIESFNLPMLSIEQSLLREARIDLGEAHYLHNNQRMLNTIYSSELGQEYYVLQIADYDVDSITPFKLQNNIPRMQNQRFSQIRFGSQVELIVPLSDRFSFTPTQNPNSHIEAGMDTLIQISEK
jgi:phosphatidylserine decarboxylase